MISVIFMADALHSECRFQWIFQEIFINSEYSKVKFSGFTRESCPYNENQGQTCTFLWHSSHYFQLCPANLCNNSSSSLIFMSFKYKWTVNTFSWAVINIYFGNLSLSVISSSLVDTTLSFSLTFRISCSAQVSSSGWATGLQLPRGVWPAELQRPYLHICRTAQFTALISEKRKGESQWWVLTKSEIIF